MEWIWDFPGSLVVKIPTLTLHEAQVQSLVRELDLVCCNEDPTTKTWHSQKKKEWKNKTNEKNFNGMNLMSDLAFHKLCDQRQVK